MSNIYEFNVESIVHQQNRVLVEADSEEEALEVVRHGTWRFLYRNYTEDDEDDGDYDPDTDPEAIYWIGNVSSAVHLEGEGSNKVPFDLQPPKFIRICTYKENK